MAHGCVEAILWPWQPGKALTRDLDKNPANYARSRRSRSSSAPRPSIPTSFGYPRAPALYLKETYARCRRLASALAKRGIGVGDTVAVMLPNIPAMYEAHFGVPMAGAVLNTLNTRLDAEAIAFMLEHGEAKLLITDKEFAPVIEKAIARKIEVIDVEDPEFTGGKRLGAKTYEELLAEGDANHSWRWPADEWEAISLNYTSGTTGNPKGVVVPPSRRVSQRGGQHPGLGHAAPFGVPVDAADVPLQRLVLSVDHGGERGHQRLPAQGRGRPVFDLIRKVKARTTAAHPSCTRCSSTRPTK